MSTDKGRMSLEDRLDAEQVEQELVAEPDQEHAAEFALKMRGFERKMEGVYEALMPNEKDVLRKLHERRRAVNGVAPAALRAKGGR